MPRDRRKRARANHFLEGVEGRVHEMGPAGRGCEPCVGVEVSLCGGEARTLTQAIRHGRLEEIEAAPLGVTVLDLEVA